MSDFRPAPLTSSQIVPITTTPEQVLQQDRGRQSLIIQANGTGELLVGLGNVPGANALSIAAGSPGVPFQFIRAPGDAVYLQASAGTIEAVILAGS